MAKRIDIDTTVARSVHLLLAHLFEDANSDNSARKSSTVNDAMVDAMP